MYVCTPRNIMELDPEQVIVLFSNRKPMWLKRMDWQEHPMLTKRRAIAPPPVKSLPPFPEMQLPSPPGPTAIDDELWNPDERN